MIIDCIAMGVDPQTTTFYLQSNIPELTYIFVLMQNFITMGRAKTTPSLSQIADSIGVDNVPMGLLAYPILEAGDIFSIQAEVVPVGKDNIDHLAITEEIITRVNQAYDADFVMPKCISDQKNFVMGLDGHEKMSKSLDNTIYIRDDENEIERKICKTQWIPCNETKFKNPIIEYLEIFGGAQDGVLNLTKDYFSGKDVEKEARRQLMITLNAVLAPMRERAEEFANNPQRVDDMLAAGTLKAMEIVSGTLEKLKKFMGMYDCLK